MTYTEIYNTVADMITEYLRLDPGELQPETHIVNDAGADSLAIVELGFKFSETFGIPMFNPTEDNLIMKNLVAAIEQQLQDAGK